MSYSRSKIQSIKVLAAALALGSLHAPLAGCGDPQAGSADHVSSRAAPSIALDTAIMQGDDQSVHAHILAGTPVNTKSMMGDTPLHIAAALGRSYAVEVLIGAGAELEVKNGSGVTPLFNAAFFCQVDALAMLIEAGAETRATDQNGMSILQIMEAPWEQMRPVYEMVHSSIGLPFDEQRIREARPQIAEMLR